MRTTLFSLLLLALVSAFTIGDDHKIKKKDNLILVDGTPYFRFDRSAIGGISIEKVEGGKLLFLRVGKYYDPTPNSKGVPTGDRYFYSIIPEGATEVLCEIDGMSVKWIARVLLEYNVLDEKGAIIEANLQRMAVHVGKPYSAKSTIISY